MFFTCGLRSLRFDGEHPEEVISYCHELYYRNRLQELTLRRRTIEETLRGFDFDEKMKEYRSGATKLFRAALAKRYNEIGWRKLYKIEELRSQAESFVRDYPVILSTTFSLRSSLSDRFVYDYVIVDEASQVDLVTGALALSCAKKAVIVGDLKQLPNVVNGETKLLTDEVFRRWSVPEAYRYSDHSLLGSVTELFADLPRVLLREHYRCHPEIIGFCNQRFYNGELIVLTKPRSERKPLVVYRTVAGNHAREHVNMRQIEVITGEVFPEQSLDSRDGSVGIVTPYRNQADALQRAFEGTRVKCDTADKFQGQERSVMIFSTVDNQIGDFASDPNRLNVAVSRAIDQFIIVTDGNNNDRESPIHELIGYVRYRNHDVIESKVRSVFDYLYSSYREAREEVLRRHGRVAEVDSENLLYLLIRDLLARGEYSKYGVVMHVPLRMLLSDLTDLCTRELTFVTNHLTHVDFLIFSKLTHQPCLVIEVDGFAYHQNEKQAERDRIKDAVLARYQIPILRLSTVESGEREKILEALRALG